ncbi:Response regulator receiver domain-containing protein [Rhodovulum sp. ES.010]|uniref:response regulator n=1 Tax=Rhodovulum sp. ES.010 TaxID=1882821 RepID=UPI000926D140|nr:response regulator [Rhodovulum sp. ES.010]SIO16817.1 Response regulator receiver domain-containing protein [Rhodovulum sp. ES.010]
MRKIAIIDDDPEVLDLLALLLAGSEFEADLAGTSEEFLALLRGGGYAGVIVDFWLKNESALELLDRLAAEAGDLPIILISGGGGGHSPEMAEALGHVTGVAAFLPKPFRREELLAILARCTR